MARKLRLEFSGACYHVINRGNYRRDLFADAGAANSFCRCLDQACVSYGWLVHAFVVMRNHFHLAVETPEPNLSEGMKWLQGTWAQRFNRFREEAGRPFQGRYKAWHVEPGHPLAQVSHYIHLNPVRAGLVTAERISEYRWSSLAFFSKGARPRWLVPSTVLRESGELPDTTSGWRLYRDYLALLAETDSAVRADDFSHLARHWAIGSTAFRAELRMKLQASSTCGDRFALAGGDPPALRQARAEVWEERLRSLSVAFAVNLSELPQKKSAVEKLTLAAAMKQTTSVSLAWLAQRLQMGATDSVASLLHRFRRSGATEQPTFKAALSGFRT
jgi:putative transposase